tara:strand:+ start:544 stop:783 length:240 start_codon:yes stop_codon:yes gene_type:complete
MKLKKKNYLTYLNDNYFYEIGYIKKESKLKNIQMKKQRQYRGSQGRRPEKAEVTYQTLKFAFILFTICMGGYLFLTLWM